MLQHWINPKYLEEKHILQIQTFFQKAKPFPHFALKDFFKEKKILEIRTAILKEKFETIDRDLFSFSQTKELFSSKDKKVKEFYTFFSSQEFISFISRLTGEKLGNKADMHAHLFNQGDYLLFHDDVVEGRKIAYVVNLSQGFTSKDGGKLQFFNSKSPQHPVQEIPPEFNSLVCFQVSEKSLHAVREVLAKKQRLTLGGWFYGD